MSSQAVGVVVDIDGADFDIMPRYLKGPDIYALYKKILSLAKYDINKETIFISFGIVKYLESQKNRLRQLNPLVDGMMVEFINQLSSIKHLYSVSPNKDYIINNFVSYMEIIKRNANLIVLSLVDSTPREIEQLYFPEDKQKILLDKAAKRQLRQEQQARSKLRIEITERSKELIRCARIESINDYTHKTTDIHDIINSNDESDLLVIKLPSMTDSEYRDIKYVIESIGCHWRERYNGFVTSGKPDRIKYRLESLIGKDHLLISQEKLFKIENKFYPTPASVATHMVETANIGKYTSVLEPSAGRGALFKLIKRKTIVGRAVECNKKNFDILKSMGFISIYNLTFEEYYSTYICNHIHDYYDRVVMNPPFDNGLDCKHIMMAYNALANGGRLVALMAENNLFYDTPIAKEFKEFLSKTTYTIEAVPYGKFKESGTSVDVVMVVIDK